MEDDFGIGRRLADRAGADEFLAQGQAIREIAVVRHREAAALQFGEERLHVAHHGFASRRIAHMPDGGFPLKAFYRGPVGEGISHEAEFALRMEARAVEGDDPCRLLSAMLKGVQTQRGDGGRVRMAENAEYAAFLAQRIAVHIEIVAGVDRRLERFRHGVVLVSLFGK